MIQRLDDWDESARLSEEETEQFSSDRGRKEAEIQEDTAGISDTQSDMVEDGRSSGQSRIVEPQAEGPVDQVDGSGSRAASSITVEHQSTSTPIAGPPQILWKVGRMPTH